MGHQISFYASKLDIQKIEDAIRRIEPIEILHCRSLDGHPRVVPSLYFEDNGKQWLFFYLVRPNDLAEIRFREVRTQAYWSVDGVECPVIELNIGLCSHERLGRGRAYYSDAYFATDGSAVHKPQDFRDWSKKVLRAIRKVAIKHEVHYFGPEAKAMLDAKPDIALGL